LRHINKTKIVIVDDEVIIHQQLKIILKSLDAELIFFSDGSKALAYITEQDDIDMLITDWLMPTMDGPELISKVKTLDNQKYTYIMLLTNLRDKESLVTGISVGADDFLYKPIIKEEIVAKISAGMRVQRLKYELKEKNEDLTSALNHIKDDLKAAAKLSMTILPSSDLKLQSVELGALFKPCEYVGGDLYGFKKITRDSLAFFQIDVAGHGIPSALFSFSLGHELSQAELFSNEIIDYEQINEKPEVKQVDRAVTAINQNSFAHNSDMYFTMTYGVLNTETGTVKYCQAGHPPLIHFCTETGVAKLHGVGGFPVGIMIDAVFEEQELQMQKGDRLFVFSDGIPEAENELGEFWGEEKLCRIIESGKEKTIRDLLDYIYQQVISWSKGEKLSDDVTIIGFQWTGEELL